MASHFYHRNSDSSMSSDSSDFDEKMFKTNIDIKEVPICFEQADDTDRDSDRNQSILDLLHTIILILTIVILLMVLNLSTQQPSILDPKLAPLDCLLRDFKALGATEKIAAVEYFAAQLAR